jgi:hypothetical protein
MIMERATGFEPATLGLGSSSRNSDFNNLAYLAYQIKGKCGRMGLISAPQMHPYSLGRKEPTCMVEDLASYRHCVERIHLNWAMFLEKRKERLKQQERPGIFPEKVAENILEDLFTQVLDWSLSDINYQVGYADFLLTRLGVKYLILEVKRPGALA